MGVLIPGYGRIPEWISQKKKESQIKLEFPMDWYPKNDFLGFAVYSVFSPLHVNCMKNPCRLKCELNFHGHQSKVLDDLPSPMDEFSSMHDNLSAVLLAMNQIECGWHIIQRLLLTISIGQMNGGI